MNEPVVLIAGFMADARAFMPQTAIHEAPWREDVLALVQDMAATLGPDQFQRQIRAMQRRPDQQKTLRKANVPTLILVVQADTIVPRRRAEFLAGIMPHGCVEVIAEAGHMPQLEQPEAVTKALETFLSGRLPRRYYWAEASAILDLRPAPEFASMKFSTSGRMFRRQLLPAKMP